MVSARRSFLAAIFLGFWVSTVAATAFSQSPLTVRGDRWLAVAALQGQVEIINAGGRRRAQVGDRLANVGDSIITGNNSSARLEVDQATGSVNMAENSQIRVQSLSITATGGRVTELYVNRGQVRLRVRPLTNPTTRLEIITPAGISGVRGTEFGVTVGPSGQTGIATEEGSVYAIAQDETVIVSTGSQSVIRPGEPPSEPVPLQDDASLNISRLSRIPRTELARIVGRTDPVNLLAIGGQQQILDARGRFRLAVPLPSNGRIRAVVTTPLGNRQQYDLVLP